MQYTIDAIYSNIAFSHRFYETESGVGLCDFPLFTRTGLVRHGFTARTGGVSNGSLSSLNMSFTREDEPRENVMENHRRFALAAGIAWESMVMDTFEHGVRVLRVDRTHAGMGYIKPSLPPCDGLVTNDPAIALITGHADCVPLYFLDIEKRAIGLAHAGWAGTLHNIAHEVIYKLKEVYQSDPKDILAGIGPCICGDCFEVDESLKDEFVKKYPEANCALPGKREGKAHVDLRRVAVSQFLKEGVLPAHIAIMDLCTFEEPEKFYSHRRDRGDTGGMSAYMQLL